MAEFDVKVGGFKGQADLDFNPKKIFMSIGDKIDEETTGDIAKFYRQYETPLAGLLGLGKLAAGKSIDPPLYERGPHSFGIRDLNLEDWPTGVYEYNTDDFNLEAEAGPQGDGWMAGLRGTYNFAEGGLAGSTLERRLWSQLFNALPSPSVANHPLVNPPTIPMSGGGLDSLNRVGWGHF